MRVWKGNNFLIYKNVLVKAVELVLEHMLLVKEDIHGHWGSDMLTLLRELGCEIAALMF